MKRNQITVSVVAVACSWYAMMVLHETGHCLGALTTGTRIEAVTIPIAGFSRTEVSGGRHPLLVIWTGPVCGAVLPLMLLPFLYAVRRRARQTLRFFVGFCLLANGAYIGAGAFVRAGDCRDLLQYGSPLWLLVGFGVLSSAGGLYAWHRMGPLGEWFSA